MGNLPAYSLGILEPDEAATIAEHLVGCASCQAELAAMNATMLALALSAPEVAAPAGARDRFAAMLRQETPAPQPPAFAPEPTPVPLVTARPQPEPRRVETAPAERRNAAGGRC